MEYYFLLSRIFQVIFQHKSKENVWNIKGTNERLFLFNKSEYLTDLYQLLFYSMVQSGWKKSIQFWRLKGKELIVPSIKFKSYLSYRLLQLEYVPTRKWTYITIETRFSSQNWLISNRNRWILLVNRYWIGKGLHLNSVSDEFDARELKTQSRKKGILAVMRDLKTCWQQPWLVRPTALSTRAASDRTLHLSWSTSDSLTI